MRTEIEAAIAMHSEWTQRLRRTVESRCLVEGGEFVLARVKADDQCSFGKWLFGPTIPESVRESARFQRVRELHADFHGAAAQVAMLATAGNAAAAIDEIEGAFAERSSALISALREWQANI